MKKLLWLTIPLLAALGWLFYRQRNAPPEVAFARVNRATVVSSLVTNGKVEPVEWAAVVAERSGVISAFHAERGARVKRGSLLAELSSEEARAGLAAAEARISQTRAELQLLERGGRASEAAALDGEIAAARLELEAARKERAALERLVEKQAATRQELTQASQRVERSEVQVRELTRRRASLVDISDRSAAEAKLREAEAARQQARIPLANAAIHSPISGVVYETQVRSGTFVEAGQEIAKVGRIDRVRVRVYVDEPELGRVAASMPVTITWDALQGRRWLGTVERLPVEVVTLGSRQVGEVICVIDNPGGDLLPGTNVNAEIRSAVAENALSIPREALRRQGDQTGVYLLQGERVVWRGIKTGISSVTRTQVLEGLSDGDAVALPGEATVTNGMVVRAIVG